MPWASYDESRVAGINPHVRFSSPTDILGAAERVNSLLSGRFRHYADAEQAKSTGGMVALVPRADDAHKLVLPGGEPIDDLHVTLAYLGEDVSDQDPGQLQAGVAHIASSFTVITARIMGHAQFNPDGGDDGTKDPCSVYLVSDSEQLPDLHSQIIELAQHAVNLPVQHQPWIPHITAGYGLDPKQLSYTGPILFDRIQFAFQGSDHFYPLLGSTTPETHPQQGTIGLR